MLAQTPVPRMLHAFSESFTCILVHVNNSQIDKFSGGTHGGGRGGGYLGQVLLGMCRWPLRTPTPL